MTPEQRKRASTAVIVPSAYGLGSGIWSWLAGPIWVYRDAPVYVFGMLAMIGTVCVAVVLNMGALVLRAWIMGEDLADPLTPVWRVGR